MLSDTLRVRVSSLHSQKLDHHCQPWGLSRSHLIRELVEALPDDPSDLPRYNVKLITVMSNNS
ncbi:hypothetical protein [Cyanothece sp. BG0011]|uniref:hypothetical protein n=1 Tax=Cyanothece sp. BG0011 TaxID=2082950 RepID=UPI000D1F28B0|nr:hypothetical protein [Cyanothece sp. BG0011]